MRLYRNTGVSNQYGGEIKPLTIKIPLHGLVVDYNSTTGAVAEMPTANICIFAGSQNSISQYQYNKRLRFFDY